MIRTLEARNFRMLASNRVSLGAFQVLVGANATGPPSASVFRRVGNELSIPHAKEHAAVLQVTETLRSWFPPPSSAQRA